MKPALTLLTALLFAPLTALHAADAATKTAESKPSILIILADDMGYGDAGFNGCKDIPTPHIDSIAKNGVRFTAGYVTAPQCAPSRSGLLSGRCQSRFGCEVNSGPERYAAENFGLPREEKTLAERLKPLGYATGMVGKWHIGFKEGLRPHERGFDYHFGFLSGAHTYLPGKRDNDPILRNGVPVEEKEYLTDAFAREAVGFLDGAKGKPFFLYFAFNAVHAPLDDSDYMKRFPSLTGKRKTYAGMLSALDDAIGRVLAKVRELGQEENTLIFFYSDNGGPTPETTSSNLPLRGYKGQFFEGGIREPFLAQWKGKLPAGSVYREMVMGFDCHATALAAAGADNCAVENVFLANCYQGIDFGHRVTGRHFIRNVYGDVLHRGIFVSQNLDVGRIENVHFWPFWNADQASPIRQYVQREAVAFEFGRSDWQVCLNTFCWGYGIGYRFITHGEGPTRGPSHGNFLGIAADACSIAVKIEETAPFGLLITNGQFVAFPGEAIMIDVAETHTGSVRFNNCGFCWPCNQIARIKGAGTLGFSDCTFVHWSRHNDRAAIHCHSGKLLVRGCEFKEDKPQITLDEAVRSAIITENLITGKLRVEHAEKANVVVANNLCAA